MTQATAIPLEKAGEPVGGPPVGLRRAVTISGSYTWGYADVGADIYVALGLVIGAAQGGAPLAFALAGLAYIMIGFAFTELASSYPVAGGGHYHSLRGLGDVIGRRHGIHAQTRMVRRRSAAEGVLRVANEEQVDAIFLGVGVKTRVPGEWGKTS